MRVAIDFQPMIRERAGVGQYTYHLAKYLPRINPSDQFIGLSFGLSHGAHEELEAANLKWRRFPYIPARGISLCWKKFDWPPVDFFAGKADLFHFPSFVARPLRYTKAVVTIHDLAFKSMPECSEPKNAAFLSEHVPLTLERVALVITDSEFIAKELIEQYRYPRRKIRVVHLGVEECFRQMSEEKRKLFRKDYGLPDKYILCVGTFEPRKNLSALIEAYAILCKNGGVIPRLVLAGGAGWKRERQKIEALVDKLKLRDAVTFLSYVWHEALPGLYAAASLFVFPSLYEGFGLPPLEAMACGVPVLCSNAPSLPEMVGDAALLFPPRDVECLAAKMDAMLTDVKLRRDMVEKGLVRARHFTWEETARKTIEAYRYALKN